MSRLHIVSPPGEPSVHELVGDSLVIGRASEADLVLPDRYLSRRHARVFLDGGRLLVEDLDSQNGTFVNGERVTAPTELRPGDVIRLSGATVTVLEEERALGAEPGTSTLFRRADEILAAGSAPAGELPTEEGTKPHDYAGRLRLLNEVHRALARPIELEELLELILDRIFDLLGPEEGAVFLLDGDGEPYRAAGRSAPGEKRLYSRALAEEVIEKGMGALVTDTRADTRFAKSESILRSGVLSMVAAPLLDPEGVEGMIALSSRAQVREFGEEDLELLVSLASVAALYIRNAALAEEAAERRRLSAEIELARRIQVSLLPDRLPEVPGYELYGGNLPSQTVSGDYYEVVARDEGRELVITVADVSGKGIGASLLTACLEALASSLIAVGQPPEAICELVSGQLHERTPPEKYATAFLAALQPASGRLRYANAGHNSALLVRGSGAVEALASSGPPLGLLPGASFQGVDAALGPGDLLVIYTDGITEAASPEDEEYGLDRLSAVCARHRTAPLADLAVAVERDLEVFAAGVPFADDRTLVLARRQARPP